VCKPKPSGVLNCVDYDDDSTCKQCGSHTFLRSNRCVAVPSEQIVDKCEDYRDASTCRECESGLLLQDNKCVQVSISNCEILRSPSECQSCKNGFFLTASLNCQRPNINNCLEYSSVNSCRLCDSNYYVNDNLVCSPLAPAELISNCIYYDSDKKCQTCTNGTILATNLTQCISFDDLPANAIEQLEKDHFCDAFFYKDSCLICKGQYLFENEQCVPCNINVPNCYFCDFENPSVCLACTSNYSMQANGSCVHNFESDRTSQSGRNVNTTYTPNNGWIFGWTALGNRGCLVTMVALVVQLVGQR
jgi:hypothetical protein